MTRMAPLGSRVPNSQGDTCSAGCLFVGAVWESFLLNCPFFVLLLSGLMFLATDRVGLLHSGRSGVRRYSAQI